MWRVQHVFRCKSCAHEVSALFLKWTGEDLHDQWIDTREQAARHRRIEGQRCERCGCVGLYLYGVREIGASEWNWLAPSPPEPPPFVSGT